MVTIRNILMPYIYATEIYKQITRSLGYDFSLHYITITCLFVYVIQSFLYFRFFHHLTIPPVAFPAVRCSYFVSRTEAPFKFNECEGI